MVNSARVISAGVISARVISACFVGELGLVRGGQLFISHDVRMKRIPAIPCRFYDVVNHLIARWHRFHKVLLLVTK